MIFSRWYGEEDFRKPLSAIGWEEHHLRLYIATRADNSKFETLDPNDKCRWKRGTQQSLNRRTTRKENANGCMTSTWRPKKITDPFFTITKLRRRTRHHFEGNEYDNAIDPKHVGGFTKGRGETCRQFRTSRQRGSKPIGRRANEILNILQALTICDFSLRENKFLLRG